MTILINDVEEVVAIFPQKIIPRVFQLTLPSDKSITHRAIFFAGMAAGQSTITNPSVGADCLASLNAMEVMGVHIDHGKQDNKIVWRIRSNGVASWQPPQHVVDAQNSGTTARLLIGVGSARAGLEFDVRGDQSLSRRPMDRIIKPLREVGAVLSGKDDGSFLPVHVEGQQLAAFEIETQVNSAQVKSALLLAAASAIGKSVIIAPSGSRDHTERMMVALGASLEIHKDGERTRFSMKGPWKPDPFIANIPGDPSSLTFFAVLAFIHPGLVIRVSRVLGNPGRLHYLSLLARMGLQVQITPHIGPSCLGEELVDISLERTGDMRPLHLLSSEVPAVIDEIPALAIACALCPGSSIFEGLSELRVKESDRLGQIHQLLELAGVAAKVESDHLYIQGKAEVKGFDYVSDDHRMVMAASILALSANKICNVGSYQAPAVSFPFFFETLRQLYA